MLSVLGNVRKWLLSAVQTGYKLTLGTSPVPDTRGHSDWWPIFHGNQNYQCCWVRLGQRGYSESYISKKDVRHYLLLCLIVLITENNWGFFRFVSAYFFYLSVCENNFVKVKATKVSGWRAGRAALTHHLQKPKWWNFEQLDIWEHVQEW